MRPGHIAFLAFTFALAVLFVCTVAVSSGAEPRKLALPDAVRLALAQNRDLRIARLKVHEYEQKRAESRSGYFPEIKNQSTVARTTAEGNVSIPAGAFGSLPNAGLVPSHGVLINQGNPTFVTSGTSATQPLTPLIRIHQANRIAASEVAATRDELKKAENEVALQVHQIYYSILTTRLQKLAAQQESAYSEIRLRESQEDVRNGDALKVDAIQSQAGVLQSAQSLLTLDLQLSDLNTQLNDLLGLPLDTQLVLSPVAPSVLPDISREEAVQMAIAGNPEIAAASEKLHQAKAAIIAAKSAYIPDVSAFARQSYQNGVPFLVHNFGTFGLSVNYDIFDFGKRRAVVREREDQRAEAEQNLERLKESVGVQIEQSLNKVQRTKQMLQVAAEVVKLRAEGERLAQNQLAQGIALVSVQRQAVAANYRAQADLLQAQFAHLLARAELEQIIGRTPEN